MALNENDRDWYYNQIEKLDPDKKVIAIDRINHQLTYNSLIRTDESLIRQVTPEEVVRALALCILTTKVYNYEIDALFIEKYCSHGHRKHDEADLIIYDNDDLPFAMWEFKSAEEFNTNQDEMIESQLFGTAPLVGAPRLLVFATIVPSGETPEFTLICIDSNENKSYDTWLKNERIHSTTFPEAYTDPTYEPFVNGGKHDLRFDCTQADFRGVAATFHAEFFGEHPDNTIFTNLMKCLLVKILDERQTKKTEIYKFQVLYKKGKEEAVKDTFTRVNELYKTAYIRYIEPKAKEPDEINPKEFQPERIKTVVKVLQGMSITRGAALHGDVIGAFFEEILRTGFKQDKGMYFTHANLVYFMLEALDLEGLTVDTWKKATHPENRLPYVIDPSCGSGTFLLRAMHIITNAIRSKKNEIVTDMDSMQFFNARMSDTMPIYWAENFIYGIDPKFIMAITAKINMVLHGDGSAHIFKYDALKSFSSFTGDKFKPLSDPNRTITTTEYKCDVVESFDVVISNPPFGINIASDTKAEIPRTFSMKESATSEALFLERWFQLLKPSGRLGVVVPESLLNTADSVDARLFLYRCFWIKAIVSLPRNLFIETPTLTSLLFAQKKTTDEITAWDTAWLNAKAVAEDKIKKVKAYLMGIKKDTIVTTDEIQQKVLLELSPIISKQTQITKKGKAPLKVTLPSDIINFMEASRYYKELFKLAGFDLLVQNFIFSEVCRIIDYQYQVYMVDEVGYKLSKRKERIRPNQLCNFIGQNNHREFPNLHLAIEPIELIVDKKNPKRILDYMRRDVKWA